MKKELKLFEKYLRDNELRVTEARQAVARTVFSLHSHFTADDLVYEMRNSETPIARATIYRTLDHLVNSSMVKKLNIREGIACYEHTYGHKNHDHIVCLKCGRVMEFSDGNIEKLQNKVCAERDFEPVGHNLKITGYCRDCRK